MQVFQVDESKKRRGLYALQARIEYITEKAEQELILAKRVLYSSKEQTSPVLGSMPFQKDMPVLFATINLRCFNAYNCKVCSAKNTCYQKACNYLEKCAYKYYEERKSIDTILQDSSIKLNSPVQNEILRMVRGIAKSWTENI